MKEVKKITVLFLCTIVLASLVPIKAYADMGPKPSTVIEIEGLGDEVYYGTLLSKYKSTGPLSVMSESGLALKQGEKDYEIWKAFVEYEDKDGYFFLPEITLCQGTDRFGWYYYPPSPFKILLYFPDYDTFVVSEVYEEYAFDSYYRIDLTGIDIKNAKLDIVVTATRSYHYGGEIIGLLIRIALTLLIELKIARTMGYCEKKQFGFIVVVNVITQILLNVWLNMVEYHSGSLMLIITYAKLELWIFAIEAFLYAMVLPIISEKGARRLPAVGYAFLANFMSFMVGLFLALVLTGIF